MATFIKAVIEKRNNALFIHEETDDGPILMRIQPSDDYDDNAGVELHLLDCKRCEAGDMCEGFLEACTYPTVEIFDKRLHLVAEIKA